MGMAWQAHTAWAYSMKELILRAEAKANCSEEAMQLPVSDCKFSPWAASCRSGSPRRKCFCIWAWRKNWAED
eukprot:scaffold37336_cov14-Tisochrysis_lutea.AAC.1